jgi:hypothetical protein
LDLHQPRPGGRDLARPDWIEENAMIPSTATPTVIAPSFTMEAAVRKVRMAEDAWNTRDPARVALANTEDSNEMHRTTVLVTKCSDCRLGNRNVLFNGAGTWSDRTHDGSVQNDGGFAAEDGDLSRVALLNAEQRLSRLCESREVRGLFLEDSGCDRLLRGDVAVHVAHRRGSEAQRASRLVADAHDSSSAAVSHLCQWSSPLTSTKRFGWTLHPNGVRSCQAKRLGFGK